MIRFLDRWVPMWEFGALLGVMFAVEITSIVLLGEGAVGVVTGLILAMIASYLLHRRWSNRRPT